jgi:hypothetical protein
VQPARIEARPQDPGQRRLDEAVDHERGRHAAGEHQDHAAPGLHGRRQPKPEQPLAHEAQREGMHEIKGVGGVAQPDEPAHRDGKARDLGGIARRSEGGRHQQGGWAADEEGPQKSVGPALAGEHARGQDEPDAAQNRETDPQGQARPETLAVGEGETGAGDEFEHDRIRPEAERHRKTGHEGSDSHEEHKAPAQPGDGAAPAEAEPCREDCVEEGLVVQGPAEAIERLDGAVGPGQRPEQEARHEGCGIAEEGRRVAEQIRPGQREGEEDEAHQPVERDHPGDPMGEKAGPPARPAGQPDPGMDDDESGDHEEQIDPAPPGHERFRGGRLAEAALRQQPRLVPRMMPDDHQGSGGAQDLEQEEDHRATMPRPAPRQQGAHAVPPRLRPGSEAGRTAIGPAAESADRRLTPRTAALRPPPRPGRKRQEP